jgi:NADPH-dependent curcumin reductase CurA
MPVPEDFEVAEVELPEPGDGEVEVALSWLSVDPYMRGRMNDARSYVPPFALGAPLAGGGVGVVTASRVAEIPVGANVLGTFRWRERDVVDGRGLQVLSPEDGPPELHLGALGMPGLTAWVGLFVIGRAVQGETVFVSAAAGAVGSVVCQLALAHGLEVVASAGGERKRAWLEELGVQRVVDYRATADLDAAVAAAAPSGLDLYFDNVGGDHLRAALGAMRDHGRIVLCGAISQYNAEGPVAGPPNLALAIGRRLRLEGFIVSDHADQRRAFLAEATRLVAEGRLRTATTVKEGLERAPEALIGLFRGENLGKMLVRVA